MIKPIIPMNNADKTVAALKSYYGTGPRNWHTRQDAFKRKRGLRDMQNPIDFAFNVLISTVLSQRTRDENTDKAAQQLFAKYSNPRQLSEASTKDIQKLIKPAGFYRQKAPRIKEISRIIVEKI